MRMGNNVAAACLGLEGVAGVALLAAAGVVFGAVLLGLALALLPLPLLLLRAALGLQQVHVAGCVKEMLLRSLLLRSLLLRSLCVRSP